MDIDTPKEKVEEKKSSHITFDDDDFDVKSIKVTQVDDSNNVEVTQKKTRKEEDDDDDDEEIVYSSEEEENIEEEPETVSLKTGREDALKLLKSEREHEMK